MWIRGGEMVGDRRYSAWLWGGGLGRFKVAFEGLRGARW